MFDLVARHAGRGFGRHGDRFHAVGLIGALLVAAAVGALAWWLVRGRGVATALPTSTPSLPVVDPAVSELRMRYARGEVTQEEFRSRIADLSPPATMPPAAAPAPAEG